ncbi:MAG: DNA phosphorothioation system sulfurtransferase DndC [Pleurocapsa sp. MO_226.B13]|nr:DNA phosphorothioation system sulfurtransferase DndC [Pleurocapsa sp. MO_226.B13]
MSANLISSNSNRSAAEFINDVHKLTTEIQELYCQDEIPWIIGVSWGKDSSCVLQLVWNAIATLPSEKRTKKIYVISTDTLVENPIVSAWVRNSIEKLDKAAIDKEMPFEAHLLHPEVKNSFWVCLMGKGYPAPRNKFRWCTERMKIKPANQFIRQTVRSHGETILVLGTRKAESIKRAETMKKHEQKRVRDRLSPNASLPNSLIYTPIEDWSTNEVWMYLMQWDNPWGGNNKDLFAMYRGATADNECPMVVDTSTPSCGDSRFGCWVCTMVNKDKSMEAMIQNDEEKEWLQPLLDIRNDLDLRNDRHRRDFRRIHGNVQLFERNKDGETSIEPIPGPYTKKWRETWLRRVLSAQVEVRKNAPDEFKDINLITPEELSEIRRIWLEEKHEFDDSLPRIYQEVTGEKFKDMRVGADEKLLGSDEWEILAEICDDEMQLELMSKLLDTERQFHTKNRRLGIYESLEKCFETSSRSKEEAIANAHHKYDLKTAAEQGDIAAVKEKVEQLNKPSNNSPEDSKLNWGSIKFAAKNKD